MSRWNDLRMDETIAVGNQPLVFTQRVAVALSAEVTQSLSLTADERTKTRRYVETDDGYGIYLRLPRGTVLSHGDVLSTASDTAPGLESGEQSSKPHDTLQFIRIIATPEPVMTISSKTTRDLMKAAYHLGNRHVPVEVRTEFLRLRPDPVLKQMLTQMGLTVVDELLPFEPEVGAYGHHH